MWWASGIQAGMSLFGASKLGSAAKKAKRIAGLNVKAFEEESAERYRRLSEGFKQIEGATKTFAAASGFSQRKGESQSGYIASMVAEHGRQLMFEQKSAQSQANIIRQGGQVAYDTGKASAMGSIGSAIGQFGQAWGMFPRK